MAHSSFDKEAEQLTEMSVRSLDLFRYASVLDGVYKCTECAQDNMQKTFKNKYSFQRHALLYHEGKHRKVFPCPSCGKEFSRPDKIKNHLKITHENLVSKNVQSVNPISYFLTPFSDLASRTPETSVSEPNKPGFKTNPDVNEQQHIKEFQQTVDASCIDYAANIKNVMPSSAFLDSNAFLSGVDFDIKSEHFPSNPSSPNPSKKDIMDEENADK